MNWRFLLNKYMNRYVIRRKWALGYEWDLRTTTLDHETFSEKLILSGHKKLLIDAGANAGRWAIPASIFYDKVMAFEPLSQTANLLRRNLKLNHIRNVEVIEKALADKIGKATFYLYEGHEMNSLLQEHISFATDQERAKGLTVVATTTIDSYDVNPDVIKIDVEGAEIEVLKGAEKTIRRCHPVLLIEVHLRGTEETIMGLFPEYSWSSNYRTLADDRVQTHLVGTMQRRLPTDAQYLPKA
jgi:FkbM family methyltransferase